MSLDAHLGEPLVICCADEGLIIVHRTSYRSLGYGFIKFAKETDAESALENMQGQITLGAGDNPWYIRDVSWDLQFQDCSRNSDESTLI
ncbi:hypothetical protein EJ110_NYTH49207 [Nymphaea thermarum]|nr:hypothetical protein EJ110_NYTH49207 [Nymphaea thermarum]